MESFKKSMIAKTKLRSPQGFFIKEEQNPSFWQIGLEVISGLGPAFGLLIFIAILVH